MKNKLKINQNISIIRDYSSGSDATTVLCMDENGTFYRKYAFGKSANKLYEQILWIEKNKDVISLAEIIRKEKTDKYCFYDMVHYAHSVKMFEYAHCMPTERTWQMLRKVLKSLEDSIYKINVQKADRDNICKYINNKIHKNIQLIKNDKRIAELNTYNEIIINGVKYPNLVYYEKFLTNDFLEKIFENDIYSEIHGDLTMENIICIRSENGCDEFYLIDPNTGNIHNSLNIDYAKLLQSLHGGYEFLALTEDIRQNKNRINYKNIKTTIYSELYSMFKAYMIQNFEYEKVRSIYFHEMVHWLRLMPYKLENGGKRFLVFYAAMIMVMYDVKKMYLDKEK